MLACGGIAARAGSTNGTPASATFINSGYPNNNHGGASLIYLGQDFEAGSMRGLVRFDLSPSFTGRITVTACTLGMTTASLASVTPAAATVYLERLTQGWGQCSGSGVDVTGDFDGAGCDGIGDARSIADFHAHGLQEQISRTCRKNGAILTRHLSMPFFGPIQSGQVSNSPPKIMSSCWSS